MSTPADAAALTIRPTMAQLAVRSSRGALRNSESDNHSGAANTM
jgi:hypothetical protein